MQDIELKKCKICNEEKPVHEFNNHGILNGKIYYDSTCKVCQWFSKRDVKYISNDWSVENDRYIVDSILNNKNSINQIAINLNIDLKDVCDRIKNVLKLNGKLKLTVLLKCEMCGRKFETTPFSVVKNKFNFCCKECHDKWTKLNPPKRYIIGKRNCKICGNEFDVYNNVKDQKYCSNKCKSRDKDIQWTYTTCANCGKEIHKSKSSIRKYKNSYCSLDCELEYKHKQKWEFRNCIICGKEFKCLKTSKVQMCSIECQGKWQSIFLSGENANGYNHNVSKEERTKICEWCGKEFEVSPYKIELESVRFCSKRCRQEWHSKIWCQQEEQKEAMRERAIYILENGLISKTLSKPQLIINNVLNDLKINYINEKGFKYYAVDNYLNDYNLIIEIMGTYWHCDYRFYPLINYSHQINRIKADKAKHTYFLNKYNIQVLYLWEYDIYNNIDLCSKLIKEYVANNGILTNYHSFNYYLNNNMLLLKDNIDKPYMDWDKGKLDNVIDITIKEKTSHKQQDKWITFNCEYCGKEREELIAHYNKHKHHYCSRECSSLGRKLIK
jgi:hypothetical protein